MCRGDCGAGNGVCVMGGELRGSFFKRFIIFFGEKTDKYDSVDVFHMNLILQR